MHIAGSVEHERPSLSFSVTCAFVLLTRLSVRCLPSFRPGTASFRSCLLLPPGFLYTLEAGNCARSRACCFFCVFLDCSFESRCATCLADFWRSCIPRKFVFHTFFLSLPHARSKCVTSWCFQCALQDWLRTNHTNLLNNSDSLVCVFFVHVRDYFQADPPFDQSSFVAAFVAEITYVRLGLSMETLLDPCWGLVQNKPTWRSGFLRATTLPMNKDLRLSLRPYKAQATKLTSVMVILQHPDQRGSPILCPGNLLGTRIRHTFENEMRRHCLLCGPDATSSTQDSSVPFRNA